MMAECGGDWLAVGIHPLPWILYNNLFFWFIAGYGSHAIGDCWLPAWLVGIQCILAVLIEAVFIGIIFAKISHPKGRSRTILISECACIARRDGILKL